MGLISGRLEAGDEAAAFAAPRRRDDEEENSPAKREEGSPISSTRVVSACAFGDSVSERCSSTCQADSIDVGSNHCKAGLSRLFLEVASNHNHWCCPSCFFSPM